MALAINDTAPDFEAQTTEGRNRMRAAPGRIDIVPIVADSD